MNFSNILNMKLVAGGKKYCQRKKADFQKIFHSMTSYMFVFVCFCELVHGAIPASNIRLLYSAEVISTKSS